MQTLTKEVKLRLNLLMVTTKFGMKDIAIYGFGGFGREIACLIKMINQIKPTWNLVGFFDDSVEAGTKNRFGSVLGGFEKMNTWGKPLNVVMAIASSAVLKSITQRVNNDMISFPNLIAPNTIIFDEESLKMGKGNVVFFGCRISCDVEIGDFNLANGAVSFGHDVSIGSYNVLSPSTRLSGNCSVGDENFFGVYSTLLQGVKVGNNVRIGAGSIVIRKTRDNSLYMGNPAKLVKI